MQNQTISIYTDGSAHPQSGAGAWAAYIFYGNQNFTLKNLVSDAGTHNRMELIAIMEAVHFVQNQNWFKSDLTIKVFTDSQYACRLPERAEKLKSKGFKNKKGELLPNTDLIQSFIDLHDNLNIELIKVKAHQKEGKEKNWNREADKLCRKLLRQYLKKSSSIEI